jgi:D-glucosaminate-6-phosphate ammonia-lyase
MSAAADPLSDLARLLTAEAARVCATPAGALVVAVAACIAGTELAAVQRLPDTAGRPRRIVLQRGHAIELGGVPLLQLLRLAGAEPVEVGTVRRCAPDELDAALADGAVAGLCVAGTEPGLVDTARCVWACRTARLPSLVVADAAAGPLAALDAGADLVVIDVAALYGGPEAGVIAGRAGLVAACTLQERGLGALFRPAPATVAATIAAVSAAAGPAGALAVPDPVAA